MLGILYLLFSSALMTFVCSDEGPSSVQDDIYKNETVVVALEGIASRTNKNMNNAKNDKSSKTGTKFVRDTQGLSNEKRNEDGRPNIILIVADDMGWGDVGANWPETVSTPNLDLLSQQGLRFRDFHSGASVCAPSRAALLTGRLGLRTGVVKNFGTDAVGGIPPNETTLAEVLQAAGYRTAIFGKWHLGMQPGHHPLDKGFHSYLGVPYSVDMGCCDPPGANLPQCSACPHENSLDNFLFSDQHSTCPFNDIALPLYHDRNISHQPAKLGHLAASYGEFATKFIQESSEMPYFLYGALSHVHVPLAHGSEFQNATGRGTFADTLLEMDWLVGHIKSAAGTAPSKNTLIWFLSDNGPWAVKCELAGCLGPFRGVWQTHQGGGGSAAKLTVWEAGHRVPAILYWPTRVQGGRVSDALTSALDILPTLATFANAKIPADRILDGLDISHVVTGKIKQGHKVLFHPNSGAAGKIGEIGAVRLGSYKVVYYSGGSPDCSGHSGPMIDHHKLPLVFDMLLDPGESSPLHPFSFEYMFVVLRARAARARLLNSIGSDNTSVVDYSERREARPCCDSASLICRCPWD